MSCEMCRYNGYKTCAFPAIHSPALKAKKEIIFTDIKVKPIINKPPDIHAVSIRGDLWCGSEREADTRNVSMKWQDITCRECLRQASNAGDEDAEKRILELAQQTIRAAGRFDTPGWPP